MRTITVNVTQGDIGNGIQCSRHSCPIALAVKRVTHEDCLSVGAFQINYGPASKSLQLAEDAINFACRFDMGQPVKPFTFQLTIP